MNQVSFTILLVDNVPLSGHWVSIDFAISFNVLLPSTVAFSSISFFEIVIEWLQGYGQSYEKCAY